MARHRKGRYWQEQVEKWQASGLSVAQYSRQAGISAESLGRWKRKFEKEACEAQASLVVELRQSVQDKETKPLVVYAQNGLRLEVNARTCPASLEKTLQILAGLS